MRIGIPKEIKNHEERVGITPAGVANLVHAGHEVLVETDAGLGSGYSNSQYEEMGAKMGSAQDAWDGDMVIKVKEPLESES